MVQSSGGLDLALEALGAEHGAELGMKHLEGHRPIVLQVMSQVDRGHPAMPKLTFDQVPAGEGGG